MMAVTTKSWVISAIAIVLALSLLAGAHQVKARTATPARPWHLEAYLESLLAECRTGPGAYYFQKEYEQLAARAEEARRSLLETDQEWWFWRDYSSCVPKLLSACLDAQLLRFKLALRRQEQKDKLTVLLKTLERELGAGNQNGKIWSRFELRNLEESRAESLAKQAEYLSAHGEYESALRNVMRAWVAWQRFNHTSDLEFARFEDSRERKRWDQQAMDLLRWTRASGRRAILVDKLGHLCLLLNRGRVEKSYPANLGRNWYRPKEQALDASTPEGEYKIKRMNPAGKYGHALMLDFPNAADRERFLDLKREGVVTSGARIGGNIEIHGGGRPDSDWTDGCVSLADDDMRDLYRRSYPGMPVTIVGASRLASTLQERRVVSRQ